MNKHPREIPSGMTPPCACNGVRSMQEMEEEMDDKIREAIREMMDGYNDGRKDDRDQVPLGMGNRSEAYIHGWMNGRDDRLGQPRRSAASLEAHAKAIIRLYPEKRRHVSKDTP